MRLLANFLARAVVMQHGITKYLRRTGAVLSDVQDLQLPLQIPKTAGFVVIRRESARQDRAGRTRRGGHWRCLKLDRKRFGLLGGCGAGNTQQRI